ncbi:hypothetical protein BDL97_02G081400 [Sphagnum fallax]|nr:hypothetical protein BDL97_02G081400 [Sphagnum fallax]
MKKLMLFCKLCLFHEKLSHCTVPGAIAASSSCTPEGGRSLVPKPQRVVRLRMFEIRAPERRLSLSLSNAAGGLGLSSGFSSFADRRGQRAREEQQLSRLLESCSGTLSLRCVQ